MSFTAKDVKALRDATGAGMMDAKKALEAADGDMEAAKQALREKGLAKADARSDRDNDEGTVAIAVDGNTAAVVQIKTETDFSAKNNAVTTLAQTLADAVLTGGPGAVDAHADAIDDLKVTIKENIELGAVEQIIAADGNILDTYLHSQDGRGVNAVVVEGNGVSQEDLHQVALHVAFAKPTYLSSDEIPADRTTAPRIPDRIGLEVGEQVEGLQAVDAEGFEEIVVARQALRGLPEASGGQLDEAIGHFAASSLGR